MLNKKSFLVVDFGATNLKLAEFELTEAGGLSLCQYGFKSLGQDGTIEATREGAMLKGLQEALAEKNYQSRNVNVCAPGYHTFSKFVKLPPVDTSKVTQIIQYEAQQNVPFPLEEVVWDYQILGAAPTGELEVLLVAIKSDVVESLFRTADKAGLRLELVDVSPAALCNAFRYNYGDLQGCTMLLDIGAKTSNLLFFEKGSVYSRGINIGANAITQDFAKESKLGYDAAEKLKIEEGFVSLGGAYEEPENAHQAAISKIARQVLTRLHIQVNQTIQFYRGQQGGSPPDRLFLSGGATSMPYTAQFFSEKLNLPVEYFNPLRNLQINEELPREELAKVAHSLGEAVGLGLRNLAHCPVELNLMPKSSLKRQQFNQKKPYLVASVFCLILLVFAYGWFYDNEAAEKQKALDQLKPTVETLKRDDQRLREGLGKMRGIQQESEQFFGWMEDRYRWAEVLTVLRESLMSVEDKKEKELNAKVGVWIERLDPIAPAGYLTVGSDAARTAFRPADATASPTPEPTGRPGRKKPGAAGGTGAASTGGINEIDTVLLTCRAVNLKQVNDSANTVLTETLAEEFRSRTNHFNPDASMTKVTGNLIDADSTNLTFSFQVTVKLARPMKL